MFDSLQCDSSKCAPQFELNSFVTMATYSVPYLTNIKGISAGHLWHSIFIFANGASYMIQQAYKYVSLCLWPCLTVLELKSLTYWNQMGGDWKKGELLLEQKGSIAVGAFSVELSIDLPSFNGLCSNLAKIALFIYLIKYWVECMTSSVISFAGICIR